MKPPAGFKAPPRIDPTFSNNTDVDYWNGNNALRPAQYDTWTMSFQRELRKGLSFEVDYNGSKGSHLQANLLNMNQVPLSTVNDLINRLGTTAAISLVPSGFCRTSRARAASGAFSSGASSLRRAASSTSWPC